MEIVKRYLPIIIILLLLITFFASGGHHYMSFQTLAEHHLALEEWTKTHYILAASGFMLIYIGAVAISMPGAVWITLLAGFLFGPFEGTVLVVVSATLGATLLFLAARTAFGDVLEKKAGSFVKKMEKGFQENALSYLLFLRLVPLFPFWLVNIVPAILNVNIRTFMVGTFFGIIPGTFVFVLIGNGLGAIIEAGKRPDLGIIFNPEILTPLIGLAILSVVPIVYKKMTKKNPE